MERNNERTYEFISDPTHKINLSGRVSAACANCRRKKIKCDGTANCRQCLEKNLECVPAPSRKRPKRDRNISSGEVSSSAAAATGLTLSNSAPATSSSTQNYSESGARLSSRPRIVSQQSQTPADDARSGAELSPNASSPSAEQRISRSISPLDSSATAFVHPRLNAAMNSTAVESSLQDSRLSGRVAWPIHRSAPDVLLGGARAHRGTSADLRSAAQALEDEAHSVRRLASSRDGFTHSNHTPTPMHGPSRGSYLETTQQQPFAISPPEQNVSFRSGLTPLISDYGQWWSVQTAAAPYQPANSFAPATQSDSMNFSEPSSYSQPPQNRGNEPDQQDPSWSRRA